MAIMIVAILFLFIGITSPVETKRIWRRNESTAGGEGFPCGGGKPSTNEKPRINERRAGGRSVSTGSTQVFGVGEAVRAAGKDLTLIGLSDRHVRLALSRGERV